MLQAFVEQAFARWDHLAGETADPAGAANVARLRAGLEPLCGLDGRVIAGAIAIPEFIRRRLGPDADRLLADLLTRTMPAPDLHWTDGRGMALLCFASPSRIVAEQTTFAMAAALERILAQRLPALGEVAHVHHATAVFELDALVHELSRAGVDFVDMVERQRQLADAGRRDAGPSWIRSMRLRFQPFWNYQDARSGPDRCITTLADIPDGRQSPPETMARVDFITFVRAAEIVQARLMENCRAALVAPIHYGTLQRRAWREDFLKLCAMVPQGCRRSIQLELLDTQGATATELRDCVRQLRAFLPGVVLRAVTDAMPAAPGQLGITGISVDLGEPHRPGRAERLLAVVQRSATERLASHAVGADTVEQAQAALSAGFTFIAGTAIHPVAQEPRMIQPTQTLPIRLAVRWATAAPL